MKNHIILYVVYINHVKKGKIMHEHLETNYAKIKQIFPKVDLLRDFLGDKQFQSFIEKK